MTAETIKRQTAYKVKIGDIINGKQIMDGERFSYLEQENKRLVRINLVANVVDKYEAQGDKKYISFTLDDASGQIRLKIFGDDVDRFRDITQGHTVMVIGLIRFYNDELYINPEIIKIQDPRYLLVRKLELESSKPKEVNKEEVKEIKDKIIEMVKSSDSTGGLETEKLILELKASPDLINSEIRKMLESGMIYEPRPGKIRYLG
ncbi:MAG: OB-fold nucleic acid binding domain-containing protein [archaeon]